MSNLGRELEKLTGGSGESKFKPLAEAIEKNREGFNAPLQPPEMPNVQQIKRTSRRRSIQRQRARGGRRSTVLSEDTLG